MIVTRCPACSTAFRVSREQLALRNGRVRCGHCYRPFDALAHRIADDTVPAPEPPSQLPPVIQPRRMVDAVAPGRSQTIRSSSPLAPRPPAAPMPESPIASSEPGTAPPSELPDLDFHVPEMPLDDESDTWIDTDPRTELRWRPAEEQAAALETAGHPWRVAEAPRGPALHDSDEALPSPVPAPTRTGSRTAEEDVEHWRTHAYAPPVRPVRYRWLWAMCIGMLLGILGVQASYIWREPITRAFPQLRPLYLEACARLGCTVPLPRVVSALVIERSNLEFSATGSPYYELQAVLRNHAPHPQQVPHIELTLTDTADQPLMRRALTPEEWLPKDFKTEDGIAAGARIEFTLPFSARELKGVTGFRVVAFYP